MRICRAAGAFEDMAHVMAQSSNPGLLGHPATVEQVACNRQNKTWSVNINTHLLAMCMQWVGWDGVMKWMVSRRGWTKLLLSPLTNRLRSVQESALGVLACRHCVLRGSSSF